VVSSPKSQPEPLSSEPRSTPTAPVSPGPSQPHPIRLVAFDLDGTLVDHALRMSVGVREAIARALQQGTIITLATGRMFSATVSFARQLDIHAPLICYQGGWIQAPEGEVLHRTPLGEDEAHLAIELGRSHGWHTVLYAEGQLYLDSLRHPMSYYERLLGPDPTVEPRLAAVLQERTADKVLFVAEPAQIEAMERVLQAYFGETAEVIQSHAEFIEVVPPGITKGAALAWLAAYLDIPREAVMAVGDQRNDLSMITWAGVGVAMGNAVPEVRAAADWIAPTLAKDGAAKALERYVLGTSPVTPGPDRAP